MVRRKISFIDRLRRIVPKIDLRGAARNYSLELTVCCYSYRRTNYDQVGVNKYKTKFYHFYHRSCGILSKGLDKSLVPHELQNYSPNFFSTLQEDSLRCFVNWNFSYTQTKTVKNIFPCHRSFGLSQPFHKP